MKVHKVRMKVHVIKVAYSINVSDEQQMCSTYLYTYFRKIFLVVQFTMLGISRLLTISKANKL